MAHWFVDLDRVVRIDVCLPGWVLVSIVSIAAAPRVAKEIAGLVAVLRRRRRD